jgi:small multidrug resistance pump
MAYAYLIIAIVSELLGTIAMKYAEGFTRLIPSALIFVCYGICFVSLTLALKTLPVSFVYALWAGVGTALMAVVGLLLFHEPLPLQKIVATSLIILGVIVFNMSEPRQEEEQLAKVESKEIQRAPATENVIVSSRGKGPG